VKKEAPRGRGGRGLGKGSCVRKLSTEEKILAKYDERNYERFKNNVSMITYLTNALQDKDRLAYDIRTAVAGILPMIEEDVWFVTVRDLIKHTTLPIGNTRVRFDDRVLSYNSPIVDEYEKFFESTMDNTIQLSRDDALFTCKVAEMFSTNLKHYRLEYEQNVPTEDDETDEE
jgi:hypothetical protein